MQMGPDFGNSLTDWKINIGPVWPIWLGAGLTNLTGGRFDMTDGELATPRKSEKGGV